MESGSMAVIASSFDSLLDLLAGFILWFTAYSMKKPNQCSYPIGKNRMQPVGTVVFASVMVALGFQVLIEPGRQLISKKHPTFDAKKELWMVGSMASVTVVENKIARAYPQDDFFMS